MGNDAYSDDTSIKTKHLKMKESKQLNTQDPYENALLSELS